MASSMIHLAATKCAVQTLAAGDWDRLWLGCVLPDGAAHGKGHLKRLLCEGCRRAYDLEGFRGQFGEQMGQDGLYLGYYLHLIQDTFYRKFMYTEHGWDPGVPGNLDKLYHDYAVTNRHVAERFGLRDDMLRPLSLAGEPITRIDDFDVPGLVREVRSQFAPGQEKETFFFSREMAEELVLRSAEFCRTELENLRAHRPGLDSAQWSWERLL